MIRKALSCIVLLCACVALAGIQPAAAHSPVCTVPVATLSCSYSYNGNKYTAFETSPGSKTYYTQNPACIQITAELPFAPAMYAPATTRPAPRSGDIPSKTTPGAYRLMCEPGETHLHRKL